MVYENLAKLCTLALKPCVCVCACVCALPYCETYAVNCHTRQVVRTELRASIMHTRRGREAIRTHKTPSPRHNYYP
jgi:hypothetical protein